MKTEKEKLQAKTVDQLKRYAKKVGAKIVTPEGKAKTKEQLVNSIVIAERLGKKNPALKAKKAPARKTLAEKPKTPKAKLDALKAKAYKLGYTYGITNKPLRAAGDPAVMALIKGLSVPEATSLFKAWNKGWTEASLELGRTAFANYIKKLK
jgi:hypothetical protein